MKIRTLLESLDVAFSMYSAIPMPQIEWKERNMKYMMAFFPMVGVVQGALLLGFSLLVGTLLGILLHIIFGVNQILVLLGVIDPKYSGRSAAAQAVHGLLQLMLGL